MVLCRAGVGGDEQGAGLVAVQPNGVGFVVQPGSGGRERPRSGEKFLFLRVSVKTGDGASRGGRDVTGGLDTQFRAGHRVALDCSGTVVVWPRA